MGGKNMETFPVTFEKHGKNNCTVTKAIFGLRKSTKLHRIEYELKVKGLGMPEAQMELLMWLNVTERLSMLAHIQPVLPEIVKTLKNSKKC